VGDGLKLVAFSRDDVIRGLGKIFANIGKAAADGSIGGVIDGILGAPRTFAEEESPERRAWRLVEGALLRTLITLVREWPYTAPPPREGLTGHFAEDIAQYVGEKDVRIGVDFFKNPATLPILASVRAIFKDWLVRQGLPPLQAASLAGRFDRRFTEALYAEWQRERQGYGAILQALDNPFADASRMEQEWAAYRGHLIARAGDPVFEEAFGLADVYIRLRGAFTEHVEDVGKRTKRSVVVDLHQEIDHWLAKGDKDDTFRLIKGGPGSGKSCFARMLAAELSERNALNVLVFPLQHFSLKNRLDDAIGEFLTDAGFFTDNPLKQPGFASPDRRLLLIFDGLDELGKSAESEARAFLGEVRSQLGVWNQQGCRVLALVTGRTVAIQATHDVSRPRDRQELEVLAYYLSDEEKRDFVDPGDLLSTDQRLEWWAKYAARKDDEPEDIPERLLSEELQELSREPLLNYLLVLSGYHQDAESQTQEFNRNRIYEKLFAGVAERKYADQPAVAQLQLKENFGEVMETIATAAWYGDGRTATLDDVRAIAGDRIRKVVDAFVEEGGGFTKLIAAFYFQAAEGRAHEKNAFEFTHKSFGEYLTARHLVRKIALLHKHLSAGLEAYDERRALEDWFRLTAPQAMTLDLLRFLRDEVRLRAANEPVDAWQDMLTKLFSLTLRDGMPASFTPPKETFRQAERRARNAEESLLAVLNACALVTKKAVTPTWPETTSAGAMLNRLRGQRAADEASTTLCILS
jgi:hypothetical protein